MEEKTSERHASDLLIACSAGHFGRHQTQGYSPTRRPTHPRGLTGAHGYSREVRAFEDRPEQQRRAARARRASFARWFVCLFVCFGGANPRTARRWRGESACARSLCCDMLHCADCVAACCTALAVLQYVAACCTAPRGPRQDNATAGGSQQTTCAGRGSPSVAVPALRVAPCRWSSLWNKPTAQHARVKTTQRARTSRARTAGPSPKPQRAGNERCTAALQTWCAALKTRRAALQTRRAALHAPALAIRSDPARSIMFSTPTDVAPSASCVRIRSCRG